MATELQPQDAALQELLTQASGELASTELHEVSVQGPSSVILPDAPWSATSCLNFDVCQNNPSAHLRCMG